jgi:predicted lipoprotein with Yx(FWY)xxD motif
MPASRPPLASCWSASQHPDAVALRHGHGSGEHTSAAATGSARPAERGRDSRRNNHQPASPTTKEATVIARIYRYARPCVSPSQARRARQRVLRRGAALSGLAGAAALVVACGSPAGNAASSGASRSGENAATANAVVAARHLSGIGTALVNSTGMTIYTPKSPAEVNGNIKCTGSCLSFWFPVTASSPDPAASGLPGKLGTIHLPDGKTQLTYDGRPLYTFRLDTSPGQAHGNNYTDSFNGTTFTWQVVTASGKPAGAGSPAPVPSYTYQAGY